MVHFFITELLVDQLNIKKNIKSTNCRQDDKFNKVIFGKLHSGRELVSYEYIKDLSLPTFLIIGNMHGDEVIGYHLAIKFIDHVEKNDVDDNINLIVIPTINPDGFALNTRRTSDYIDMNRDFHKIDDLDSAPETNLSKKYFRKINEEYFNKTNQRHNFAINYHGGALVVSYPLDSHKNGLNKYSLAENNENDNNMFEKLALTYASNHKTMNTNKSFKNGITNGSEWYHVSNSMQDWLYTELNMLNFTIEASVIKNPLYKKNSITKNSIIEKYWLQNKEALLTLITEATN
jgi:hypothetical protein